MTLERKVQLLGRYILLGFIACVFIFPIIFMIVSSLKPDLQLLSDSSSVRAFLPVGDISLDNYREAFDRAPVALFIFNSVFITATTLILSIFLASVAAFAFVFIDWWGKSVVLALIIATYILPFETVAVPLLLLVNNLPWLSVEGVTWGWLNSYQVQIIPWIIRALEIFLFVQYFRDLPREPGRIEPGRGRQLVPDLPQGHHAAVGTGHRDGRDPEVSGNVQQPVHLADHGGSGRGPAADHGRSAVFLPAEHRMGRDHGLSHHHHGSRAGFLSGPAAGIHRLDRIDRGQGLIMLALDDHWVWDSWYLHDGHRWHCWYLKAPKSLGDPSFATGT